MARLIHLNGPSRVGKTTLARRYAENHPRTLCLDVDALVGQVDGWREDFSSAFLVATAQGLALVKSQLREGQDVVVPQLVTIFDQGNQFEAAATEVGARYVEVALPILLDTTVLTIDQTYGRLMNLLDLTDDQAGRADLRGPHGSHSSN
jgi:hypothetical protein